MKLPRRTFLQLAASAAALPAVSRFAWAQAYPSRQVTILVGFPVGGGIDIDARLMAQWLSDRLSRCHGSGRACARRRLYAAFCHRSERPRSGPLSQPQI